MLSRREVLSTAAAAGVAAIIPPWTRVLASASQPVTLVNFDVPAGARVTAMCTFLEIRNAFRFQHRVPIRQSWRRSTKCGGYTGLCARMAS